MNAACIPFPERIPAVCRLSILVVDDDPAVATTIKMVLKRLGHSVDVLHDADDAVARIAMFPRLYDILVTDHCMYNTTGLELLARLANTGFRGGVIILSAYIGEETQAEYLAMGAGMILQKPFEINELRHAVEAFMPLVAA